MRRRAFIAASAALLISPPCLRAQGTPRRIGLLFPGLGPGRDAWRSGWHERGWIEGNNLLVEYRSFAETPDRIPALATELVALNPDLVIVVGPQATLALKSATAAIPIVFIAVADPVSLGIVQSLSRPGGNITGFSTFVPGDFLAKRLEILKELVPGASKIALLANPNNPIHRLVLAEEMPNAARKLGVALLTVEATTPEEIDAAFAAATAQHADAIVDLNDSLTNREATRVVALAAKHRLPAGYLLRQFAVGGLVVYGPDLPDLIRRSGDYVDRILRGAKPSDLPIQQPTKYELVINMKTARTLGLTVPPSLLARADEVIE